MSGALSRRDFLKIGGLSLAALAFHPFPYHALPWPPGETAYRDMAGRVTNKSVFVYVQPDLNSRRIHKIERDRILPLVEEITSPYGPAHNPRWYRLFDGYIHSAHIQRVENATLNKPLLSVAESGHLGEVTVPYTQTMYKSRKGFWMPLYRLYFQSIHWITGLVESPEGKPWYRLTDEWLKVHYYIPVEHMRVISPEELSPLSPNVPQTEKRIEISLDRQLLEAYEGNNPVIRTRISSGKRYMETPQGEFQVDRKYPSKHMGDGGLTSNLHAYELVGVPWVTFFHRAGIACHGTFWHDNFGTPMSRGCINMRNQDAKWLFRWCLPTYDLQIKDRSGWKLTGAGTTVIVT